jgi:hypothetical protein
LIVCDVAAMLRLLHADHWHPWYCWNPNSTGDGLCINKQAS